MGWRWDAQAKVLFIPAWFKHNKPDNKNAFEGALKDAAEVPQSPLLTEFWDNDNYLNAELTKILRRHAPTVPPTVGDIVSGRCAPPSPPPWGNGPPSITVSIDVLKTDPPTPQGGKVVGRSDGAEEPKPPAVGRPPDPPAFDPLKAEADQRRAFVVRWNAVGMRHLSRLNPSLQSRLNANLLDPWWAENYPTAIEKAGTIPFLQAGTGRQAGPLDVFDFLKEPDLVRQILDGRFDPRPKVGGKPGPEAAPYDHNEAVRRTKAMLASVNVPAPPMAKPAGGAG